jgi:hypothetical protein
MPQREIPSKPQVAAVLYAIRAETLHYEQRRYSQIISLSQKPVRSLYFRTFV